MGQNFNQFRGTREKFTAKKKRLVTSPNSFQSLKFETYMSHNDGRTFKKLMCESKYQMQLPIYVAQQPVSDAV